MQVLLLSAGTVTSRLNMQLAEQGHAVIAQIAVFTTQHIDLFDFRVLVAVSSESSVSLAETRRWLARMINSLANS